MRTVFFGTPEVSAVALRALLDSSHDVVAVVTQPDRPRGRGKKVTPSPVKEVALERGLPVLQPETPKQDGFAAELRTHAPDALAVVAYGHILPVAVLEVAPAINVHFSLLPRYRGAAPVQRALMDGATETGVSVFLLEPTVDTGPVLVSERVGVSAEDTAGELLERLTPIGAALLVRALDALAKGSAQPQPQDAAAASPAPKIRPDEAAIDWARPAREIANRVRALNPSPGAFTVFRGRRLMVWRAGAAPGTGEPGAVLDAGRERFVVGCGEGVLAIQEVQPEGRRAQSAAEFCRGYRPSPGEALGGP